MFYFFSIYAFFFFVYFEVFFYFIFIFEIFMRKKFEIQIDGWILKTFEFFISRVITPFP